MRFDQLALRRGFGPRLERTALQRPSALDRWLALQWGLWARRADWPRANLRLAWRDGAGMSHAALDDAALDARLAVLRGRLRREGLAPASTGPALALVAEVARRSLGVQPHPVQRAGARLLLQGQFIEMDTGEGKSLTAALAAGVAGLAGLPVDVFTVNDYLARRDAAHFGGFYSRLGLRVAALTGDDAPEARAAACGCPVLYTVNKDHVFDYLRHRLQDPGGPFAGRGLHLAIVDEADSILIDEARTPLVIARESERLEAQVLRAVAAFAATLPPAACTELPAERRVRLAPGQPLLLLRAQGIAESAWPDRLLREMVEQALAARAFYRRDRDYIVVDGKVAIVDEYTGRVLADRSWERGLHQFIELAEGLAPTAARETLARITFPEFFRRYLILAGASGTLRETAPELMAVYGQRVRRLPTHRPPQRRVAPLRLFRSGDARWQAVVQAVAAARRRGQAVLVGTRSVAASMEVARRLAAAGIDAAVLNAREHAAEAAVVAAAGSAGRVTVATNMAGRGTDIAIDAAVRAAGGLCVVLTELHESARIDRQLMGRAARQGDPGQALLFASLEDELFRQHLPTWLQGLLQRGPGAELPAPAGRWLRRLAQGRAEGRHRAERAQLLDRSDALARQLGFAGPAT